MQKIVFATNNQHKLDEIRSILGEQFEIVSLRDIGCDVDIPETADTLEGNAMMKAQYIWDHYHMSVFADDTGLEVEALNGAPGVFSARYAGGEGHDSEANMQKLLRELTEKNNRRAQFRTVIALILKRSPLQLPQGGELVTSQNEEVGKKKPKYKTADSIYYEKLKEFAKENKNHLTTAETWLWKGLKNNNLGVSFRRQHIIGNYIVDYVCLEKRIVIEVDGSYHGEEGQISLDTDRTKYIESQGFRVIRFTNEEITNNLEGVLKMISQAAHLSPLGELEGASYLFEGIVKGQITRERHGSEGFGYDPIFQPDGYDTTFAELGMDIKNHISHRARAVKKLADFLSQGK